MLTTDSDLVSECIVDIENLCKETISKQSSMTIFHQPVLPKEPYAMLKCSIGRSIKLKFLLRLLWDFPGPLIHQVIVLAWRTKGRVESLLRRSSLLPAKVTYA